MKKFNFSLSGVQRYKDQMLDLVKMEYAEAEGRLNAQLEKVEELKEKFRSYNAQLKQRIEEGINVIELNSSKMYLADLQKTIDKEIIKAYKLEDAAEEVKQRMVEAKVESASIEILYDRQLAEYKEAERKSNETFIEEFVSSRSARVSVS